MIRAFSSVFSCVKPDVVDCTNLPPLDLTVSKNWYENSNIKFKTELDSDKNIYKGPTTESNWLIPGRLLVGAYPSQDNDLVKIMKSGINTFVCLNNDYGYFDDKMAYADLPSVDDGTGKIIINPKLFGKNGLVTLTGNKFNKENNFLHLPIIDMKTADDDIVSDFCLTLKKKICMGENIYIHCTGGHGRTGTISAILLCLLYKITPKEALEYVQYSHDQRMADYGNYNYTKLITDNTLKNKFALGQVPSPQTSDQREQVIRIIKNLDSCFRGGRIKQNNLKSRTKTNKGRKIKRKSRKTKKTKIKF
jgi:hypothetical protein